MYLDYLEELLNDKARRNHHIILEHFNIPMTGQKFACLREGQWINDEIISFHMCLLQKRDDDKAERYSSHKKSHYFNSFFYQRLVIEKGHYDFNNIKRWTKKFNIFEKERI